MVPAKKLLVITVVLSLLLLPAAAAAADRDAARKGERVSSGYMTADIFAARPVGLVSTIFGTATFIVSSPFSALGGNLDHAFDELVKKPFNYTFKRPIGVF